MKEMTVNEMLEKYKELEYNGYRVAKLGPEGIGKASLYYEPLVRYRIYNKYSPQGDCEILENKDAVISYVMANNKYEGYYNRLNELSEGVDFDFSYDLYKYLTDWIENYFGYGRVDFQVKYKDGKLSKMCKAASIDIDNYGKISIGRWSDGIHPILIEPMDSEIKYLIVRFKQRIKGPIIATFPINFIGAFKTTYDMLELRCMYGRWFYPELDKKVELAYKNNVISKIQYEKLLELME